MLYEIKTDRLILRPLDISDLATVHTYASDEENTKYMFWLPNDTIEETKQFLSDVTNEWKKRFLIIMSLPLFLKACKLAQSPLC